MEYKQMHATTSVICENVSEDFQVTNHTNLPIHACYMEKAAGYIGTHAMQQR